MALDIIHQLHEKGEYVQYHDPHVPVFRYDCLCMTTVPDLDKTLSKTDCIIVVTGFSWYKWEKVQRKVQVIVDMRNALNNELKKSTRILYEK